MTRIIKFRGRVPDTDKVHGGKIVYGYLVVYPGERMYTHWIFTEGDEPNYPVEPESVAQLISVDKDGQEIYEGDYCEWANAISMPFPASFEHFALIKQGEVVLST